MKKLLFMTGEGIGNCISLIPTLRTLKESLGYSITLWHAFGSYAITHDLIPYVEETYLGGEINKINPALYEGKVSTFWTRDYHKHPLFSNMKLLTRIHPLSMMRSEVSTYMRIAQELGAKPGDIKWHGECNYNKKNKEKFDTVLSNGYNHIGSARWEIKSYKYYDKLAKLLTDAGYSVCSIGGTNEYIKNTVNRTGLPLLDSLALIKNSKLLISNDSGMYHCANALSTKNITIFTATSIKKNYDKRFHKFTKLIYRDDLKCRPCQSGRKWVKQCRHWNCQKISPSVIMDEVKELI